MDDLADLAFLDPDPEVAAAKYTEYHTAISRWFEWKGCRDANHLADEVLRRGCRRLREGVTVDRTIRTYLMGIARFVLMEERNAVRNRTVAIESAKLEEPDHSDRVEARLAVQKVLAVLAAEDRQLLKEYFGGDRVALAKRLRLTAVALRVRVHRLLNQVRSSHGQNGSEARGETNSSRGPLRDRGRE